MQVSILIMDKRTGAECILCERQAVYNFKNEIAGYESCFTPKCVINLIDILTSSSDLEVILNELVRRQEL
jgi:hypothetical protein